MARSSARPGRTVAVFFLGLAIAYGLVALIGTWKPALGLDLEGGTQITLIAENSVPKDQLEQAASIIDARVNGSGVSEAEVTTQGSNEIVVQVPGSTKNTLLETVERSARLRFRLVAQVPQTAVPQTPTPSGSASPSPGAGVTAPPTSGSSSSSTGKNRTAALTGKHKLGDKKGTKKQPSQSPTTPVSTVPDSTSKITYTAANKKAYEDALTWQTNPDPQSVAVYNAYTCP
jgi:preprotein translocase subunit SecD